MPKDGGMSLKRERLRKMPDHSQISKAYGEMLAHFEKKMVEFLQKEESMKKAREIWPIEPSPLPFGYFDSKGKFISVRNNLRKFEKKLKSIAGISLELLGKTNEQV